MQTILHGISSLSEALGGSRRVFLVCGRTSWQNLSVRREIESAIRSVSPEYIAFNDFKPNPTYEDVRCGVMAFNASSCDTIVAVGGGSCIDVAKCIKLFCRLSNDNSYLSQTWKDTGIRLVALPTTAGSGSESTQFAVIYYNDLKHSLSHPSILPDYAILEPSVLESLPPYQRNCAMMDALCQAIESWWSLGATRESISLSRRAIDVIMHHWREYVFNHSSGHSIMSAANYAGQAINITRTTAPHAFSYKLTSTFGLPHGRAVALCLPEIWRFMTEHTGDPECISQGGLEGVFSDIALAMGCSSPGEAIELLRKMNFDLGLDRHDFMKAYGRKGYEDLICSLASSVNPERLANNPIPITSQDATNIYDRILGGWAQSHCI